MDVWRAILIVQKEDVKHMDRAIQRLLMLRMSQIHIFAEAGVRISQRFDHALHQDSSWDCAYKLWKGTCEIAGRVYASESQLFLVTRPGCYYWKDLPEYCETTIPREANAVWCPHTPNRVFPSESIQRPRCQGDFRWCQTPVHADVEINHCFVVTGNVLTLMGFYLPPNPECAPVGCSLAAELSRRHIDYMFHLPSLVDTEDHCYQASDFVGCAFEYPNLGAANKSVVKFNTRRRK